MLVAGIAAAILTQTAIAVPRPSCGDVLACGSRNEFGPPLVRRRLVVDGKDFRLLLCLYRQSVPLGAHQKCKLLAASCNENAGCILFIGCPHAAGGARKDITGDWGTSIPARQVELHLMLYISVAGAEA